MGNQRRQTKRERKLEAKARRMEEIRRAQRRALRRRIVTILTALAAIAGIVAWAVLSGKSTREAKAALSELATGAECTELREPPNEGHEHVEPGTDISYESTPPTSGNHYGTPGPVGVLDEPVPDEVQVHNLEHGHIMIQHNNVDDAILQKLIPIAQRDAFAQWIVVAPYPQMTHKLAFTAWDRIITCDEPTEEVDQVALKFIELFRDKSPRESVPGTPVGAQPPGEPTAPPAESPDATTPPAESPAPSPAVSPS